MSTLSFVIPVYRNAGALALTYQKLVALFDRELAPWDYDIVFVDDGSDDASPDELRALRARDNRVRVITFTRNFGQMAAIQAGLKTATGDAVLQMSADL